MSVWSIIFAILIIWILLSIIYWLFIYPVLLMLGAVKTPKLDAEIKAERDKDRAERRAGNNQKCCPCRPRSKSFSPDDDDFF